MIYEKIKKELIILNVFVLSHEKKYFAEDNYKRTESFINGYDNQNSVLKIIKQTKYRREDNSIEN